MIRVTETGRNPTMRYFARTHRVSVAWLHETFSHQDIDLVYEVSSNMCADIYTKAFTDASKWMAAFDLINIVDPSRLQQFITGCVTPPPPVALSSPFVDEPNRYDYDADVEQVDDDRRLIEVSVVDHDSGHDFNVYPRIIQRGGEVSGTLNSVSKAIKSFYREPLVRTSLTNTHYEAIKTCVEGFNQGTRIGRSWGAALQHDQYFICDGGSGIRNAGRCTKAEHDKKLVPDITGNLADAKVQNAVSIINFIASKYMVDLKWDFLIIGQKCERLEPWNTASIPQDITEGICGIISMGHATDCQGFVNRMHYQQQFDKEIMYFDRVDVSSKEEIYEVEWSEGFILLGKAIPSLPYTDTGNLLLGELGFHYGGDHRFKFPTQVSPALPAKVDYIVKDEKNDRIIVEGCTSPDSLMSRLTPSSKGCTVIPIDRNIDWRSKGSYDVCIGNLTGRHCALWFSSPCTGGSMWSHINLHRSSSTVALILSHWEEFHRLWKRFEEIAKIIIPKGVATFIEWPRGCRYWASTRVARFLD